MDEEGRKGFGRYIRTLRSAAKLSQKDAAEKAGISAPYLAQLERGQRNPPSRRILSRLAELYERPSQELWQRAEYAEGRKEQSLDAAQIEWAFQAASNDSRFSYGHRARSGPLTLEQKAWFVELYEKSTGRRLLIEQEPETPQEEDKQE